MAKYVPPQTQQTVQYAQQPVVYQQYVPVVQAPVQQYYVQYPQYQQQYVRPAVQVQQQQVQQVQQVQPQVVNTESAKAPLKGSSRIEYVPYQRKVVDYETQTYSQVVPKERYVALLNYNTNQLMNFYQKVTDYYAIEHTTNYVPQTYYDSYVDYVPVQRYKERTEYYPVESSRTVINRQNQNQNQQYQQY